MRKDGLISIGHGAFLDPDDVEYRYSRSGGPGGQNVNKVASRVELRFTVAGASTLTSLQKETIAHVLRSRLDTRGTLRIAVQTSRSQWRNRQLALEKLVSLLREALKEKPVRRATKASAASRARRITRKKQRGELKRLRRSASAHE